MALKNKPSSRISGISLRTKLVIGSGLATAVGLMLSLSLLLWFAEPAVSQTIVKQFSLLLLIIFGLSICIAIAVSYLFTRHLATSLMALEVGLLNFKDNDFSVSLPVGGSGAWTRQGAQTQAGKGGNGWLRLPPSARLRNACPLLIHKNIHSYCTAQ